jgi:hypothetical protein
MNVLSKLEQENQYLQMELKFLKSKIDNQLKELKMEYKKGYMDGFKSGYNKKLDEKKDKIY